MMTQCRGCVTRPQGFAAPISSFLTTKFIASRRPIPSSPPMTPEIYAAVLINILFEAFHVERRPQLHGHGHRGGRGRWRVLGPLTVLLALVCGVWQQAHENGEGSDMHPGSSHRLRGGSGPQPPRNPAPAGNPRTVRPYTEAHFYPMWREDTNIAPGTRRGAYVFTRPVIFVVSPFLPAHRGYLRLPRDCEWAPYENRNATPTPVSPPGYASVPLRSHPHPNPPHHFWVSSRGRPGAPLLSFFLMPADWEPAESPDYILEEMQPLFFQTLREEQVSP